MARTMRILLISLMVVLLPLRGWAGDLMAVDMASSIVVRQASIPSAQTTVASVATQAYMPADCMLFAQPSPDATNHCSNCDTCELCLAVVNPTVMVWSAGQWLMHSSPLATNASFTSASSASNLKPPIS